MPATPAWPPKSAPRLFVTEPLAAGTLVRIEGNPAHYLTRVMRVATGDAVIQCDDVSGKQTITFAFKFEPSARRWVECAYLSFNRLGGQ